MAKGDNESRVSTLEANMFNVSSTVLDIKKYLIDNSEKVNTQHIEIVKQLSIIETKQDNFTAYQTQCDADRAELATKVDSCVETQKVQKRVGSVFMVLFSMCTAAWEAFKH